MGQPEQFAKDTFAQEVSILTHGALAWQDPPEIRLLKVQADGMLLVRDPAHLAELLPPWTAAAGHDEIMLELKMAGDHLDLVAIERTLLRRQARQVERLEAHRRPGDAPEKRLPPWLGMEPIWVAAPNVPEHLRTYYTVERFAPGCYRVGPAAFSFIWIAANELPLRDDLVPFLLARSGKQLDRLALWLVEHRPAEWMLRMLRSTAMTDVITEYVYEYVKEDSPEVHARLRELAKRISEEFKLKDEWLDEGRLVEARSSLRRVLARRGLALRPDDDARIDACTDLGTLERWLDDAVVAKTITEVFDQAT